MPTSQFSCDSEMHLHVAEDTAALVTHMQVLSGTEIGHRCTAHRYPLLSLCKPNTGPTQLWINHARKVTSKKRNQIHLYKNEYQGHCQKKPYNWKRSALLTP